MLDVTFDMLDWGKETPVLPQIKAIDEFVLFQDANSSLVHGPIIRRESCHT